MKYKYMITILLIIGTFCFALAYYLYQKNKSIENNLKLTNEVTDIQKEKGNQFEDFVLDAFLEENGVKLVSKVSDYYKNGNSAEDNKTPDLKLRYNQIPFAIECKYRKDFNSNGYIEWAKDYQIKNYQQYESQNKSKVFVAIGIGGSPNSPAEWYLVPLYKLSKPFAYQSYIQKNKVKSAKFFLKQLK